MDVNPNSNGERELDEDEFNPFDDPEERQVVYKAINSFQSALSPRILNDKR